jgi:hypothetical protein
MLIADQLEQPTHCATPPAMQKQIEGCEQSTCSSACSPCKAALSIMVGEAGSGHGPAIQWKTTPSKFWRSVFFESGPHWPDRNRPGPISNAGWHSFACLCNEHLTPPRGDTPRNAWCLRNRAHALFRLQHETLQSLNLKSLTFQKKRQPHSCALRIMQTLAMAEPPIDTCRRNHKLDKSHSQKACTSNTQQMQTSIWHLQCNHYCAK